MTVAIKIVDKALEGNEKEQRENSRVVHVLVLVSPWCEMSKHPNATQRTLDLNIDFGCILVVVVCIVGCVIRKPDH